MYEESRPGNLEEQALCGLKHCFAASSFWVGIHLAAHSVIHNLKRSYFYELSFGVGIGIAIAIRNRNGFFDPDVLCG